MDGKLYIKKFIRDDGETLELDAEELYLAEQNTLLVRPNPNTTAVEFTGADGGEMIHQRNAIYTQTINGLLVPKTSDYWTLCSQLSQFFQINHTFKIIYIKKDGGMFAIQDAWISTGLQIVPVPYETYSVWSLDLAIGNTSWTEYAEDGSGKEIFSNLVTLPLITTDAGGEMWDPPIATTGKNLFSVGFGPFSPNNYNDCTFRKSGPSSATFTFPSPLPVGIYTFSGKVVSKTTVLPVTIEIYHGSSVVVLKTVQNTGNFSFSFSSSTTITSIRIYIASSEPSSSAYMQFSNLQLESGSTATAYEPYGTVTTAGGEVWDNTGAKWEAGAGGIQTIDVASAQTIYPVWTVEGPCVNPSLQNDTTDTSAVFNGSIAVGQTLVVDFATGIAYLDSALVTRYVAGGVSLAPGNNNIGFNTDGGANETSTIQWNNIIN